MKAFCSCNVVSVDRINTSPCGKKVVSFAVEYDC